MGIGNRIGLFQRKIVPSEIQQGSGNKFGGFKALIMGRGPLHFFHQFGWNNFTGFGVLGINRKDIGFSGPMLHNLRRKFGVIAGAGNACVAVKFLRGHQPMQAMAKFMEQGFHFTKAHQGRLAIFRFYEV